jgi:hypothetical protein
MVRFIIFYLAFLSFAIILVFGFFNGYSFPEMLMRGGTMLAFIIVWGLMVTVISAVVKADVDKKRALREMQESQFENNDENAMALEGDEDFDDFEEE